MADYKNVMIFGEIVEGKLASITKELLGGGRKLADELGEELHAVLLGHGVTELAREAIAFGADKAYVVDDPKLSDYQIDLYSSSINEVIERIKPRVLLFGHTDIGADLGPRLSFRLDRAIATDCVELSVEPDTKHLLRTKPVYGGMAMATFTSEGFPQMATVRPKSLAPAEWRGSAEGLAVPIDVELVEVASSINFVERVTEEAEGIKLEDAEVIVAGGRGIGDAEGFKKLEEAAKLLRGAVGGSRVAVDNGWIPTTMQVGITGKIVAPKLYLAVAISGASQHMTGCSRSQRIVAINKDLSAPIFKQAHFGVVGDWKIVLPAFLNKLKTLE
ncbi:MAG: electron transfer flavoprotein subunit alpha/FixB family protein [Deltaproteobacteria bacterium]|nr:MAG: electron transfer flavoprotein subunit alpha/FixB family protein [Deltaproteobacteria bacterium]